MNSKTVLNIVAATILVAAVLVTPTAHAREDTLTLPATTDIIEQTWHNRSDATPAFEKTDVVGQILLPFSDEIDQNQPNGPNYMAGFDQADLAQSFMQTNGNISGAGILLQEGVGSSDNVTIQLWDELPNAGGTMLAEASATGTSGQWVDVFWTAVLITPSTTYYLVFLGNTTLGIAGDTSNPYPDGHVFANDGFQPFPGYDYAFRTYYDTEVSFECNTWASVKSFFN